MFRHALVLAVAVAVALGAAHQLVRMANAPATAQVVAQPAPDIPQPVATEAPPVAAVATPPDESCGRNDQRRRQPRTRRRPGDEGA